MMDNCKNLGKTLKIVTSSTKVFLMSVISPLLYKATQYSTKTIILSKLMAAGIILIR